VILQEVLPDDKNLIAPPIIVVGVDVKDCWNQGPDVLDGNGLGVKIGDRSGFMEEKGLVKTAGIMDLGVGLEKEGSSGSGSTVVARSSSARSRASRSRAAATSRFRAAAFASCSAAKARSRVARRAALFLAARRRAVVLVSSALALAAARILASAADLFFGSTGRP
jgi:hypothetical protein